MRKKRIHNFSANFLQHAWNWTLRAYSGIECGKYLPIAIKCSFRFRIKEDIREFVFNETSIKLKDRNIGYSTRYYSGDWNLSICPYGELRRRRGYFMPLVFNIFDITFDISKLIGRTAFPARVTLISISHFVPGDRRSVPRHRYVLVSRFDKYWIAAAAKRLVACVIKRDICTYIRRKDVTYAFSFKTHGKGGKCYFFRQFFTNCSTNHILHRAQMNYLLERSARNLSNCLLQIILRRECILFCQLFANYCNI